MSRVIPPPIHTTAQIPDKDMEFMYLERKKAEAGEEFWRSKALEMMRELANIPRSIEEHGHFELVYRNGKVLRLVEAAE